MKLLKGIIDFKNWSVQYMLMIVMKKLLVLMKVETTVHCLLFHQHQLFVEAVNYLSLILINIIILVEGQYPPRPRWYPPRPAKTNPVRPQTPPSPIGSHDSLLLTRFYKIQYGQPKPSKEELLHEIRLAERQVE